MKVTLGDLKLWRKGNIIILFMIFFSCIGMIYLLDAFHAAYAGLELNTLILIAGLTVFGMIENSRLFKPEYPTSCDIGEDTIKIKNDKAEWLIRKEDVRNISYKEIRYGGRWLEPIGYRLIVETKNERYCWDSVFREEEKWEDTEIFCLYQYLIHNINFLEKGMDHKK